ncbi:hypothetical protein [Deinococcus humi]|uniref:Uncharacterized protein n=1 Tax=Deinococcus humi TaxID=662880 RepID=A0A7W8NJN0_9DEIO|nr:hypothetical protein [Deinococcus humi]MBB5366287.1 hypothetical protein [Deinococcus humi]
MVISAGVPSKLCTEIQGVPEWHAVPMGVKGGLQGVALRFERRMPGVDGAHLNASAGGQMRESYGAPRHQQ